VCGVAARLLEAKRLLMKSMRRPFSSPAAKAAAGLQ
jgi:hypothetical protein